jgi:uncharacterized protein YlxW (UPF0749 family)
MTRFEALATTTPFFAVVATGLLFLLVIRYTDNRATEKQKKQKQAEAARQAAGSAVARSELSEAERVQLHIETLEAFASAVRDASAAVEESSRHVHMTTAAQRAAASEQHQPS